MRILFMGTPEIAADCLRALLDAGETVVGAVCQPDRPQGRGMVLTPPPVKVLAQQNALPVFQPDTLKDGAFLPVLEQTEPDLIAVVAYGKILPTYILEYPKHGCINVHVSLLPHYRGAAPMQRAVMNGDTETGVTVMQMDAGMDTGDILLTGSFPIGPDDTFGDVYERSVALGARMLCCAVRGLDAGTLVAQKQPAEGVSYAEKITKADCLIDFSKPAAVVYAVLRGLTPIPLGFTHTPDGKLLKIAACRLGKGDGEPGRVIALSDEGEGGITVACGTGSVTFTRVVPEGKGKMTAADLIRGRKIALGDLLC